MGIEWRVEREHVAHHEAGHAVVAHELGWEVVSVELRDESQGCDAPPGASRFDYGPGGWDPAEELAVAAAGMIAELILLGHPIPCRRVRYKMTSTS